MIDSLEILSALAGQDLSQVVGTYATTNVKDFGSVRDTGVLNQIEINVMVIEAFVGATATLQVFEQWSLDNSTFYTVLETPLIPVASLTAGRMVLKKPLGMWQPLLLPAVAGGRYYRLLYGIATATTTSGTLAAWLSGMDDREEIRNYARNYTAPPPAA